MVVLCILCLVVLCDCLIGVVFDLLVCGLGAFGFCGFDFGWWFGVV